MERKTVHALLLSLAVVAGGVMMTTDAHAQTNTERLMTTVDNTNSILDALAALADAVADGFASVLAAIGMVQDNTSSIMTELGHVESDVAGISSDVASLDSSVAAVSSDVASIADDVADVNSNLQSVQNDVAGLSAGLAGSTAAFASISEAVQNNQNAINTLSEKLDMISEAVGAVQTTVETQEDVDPALTNVLYSDKTEQAVAVADFAGALTKAPNDGEYEASNVFSCTGDVFLDTVMVDDVNGVLTSAVTAAAGLPASMVTVEGFSLLETYDSTEAGGTFAPGNVRDIGEERDFDNRFLSAGSTLVIKGTTDQSDGEGTKPADFPGATAAANNWLRFVIGANEAGDAGNVTYFDLDEYANLASRGAINATAGNTGEQASKAQLSTVELYTIIVTWFAPSADTECSISTALGAPSGLTDQDDVLVTLDLADDEASKPSAFEPMTVDCGGEPTEITNASINVGSSSLNPFVTVTLMAGGESADIKFDANGALDEDNSELPFAFAGDNLTVGGEGAGLLLIKLDYFTTENNSCEN